MKFADIIGRDTLKQQLIRTVKENRISHAQLFLGPAGSQKLALAIAYAQYVCCENKKENDACGVCSSCVKYEKLIHPDLHFVYPTNSTEKGSKLSSVDFLNQWRELMLEKKCNISLAEWYAKMDIGENKQGIINTKDCNEINRILSLKTYEANFKVMIIWMAEKLYYTAAPKILKILEEPPENTLFLLVAEDAEQLLTTILSRTQLVKISKIKSQDLYVHLIQKENVSSTLASKIAKLADGNYKEAINLVTNSEGQQDYFIDFREWMRACQKFNQNKDAAFLLGYIKKTSLIGRERLKSFLGYCLHFTHEYLLIQNNCEKLVTVDSEEEATFIENFSPFLSIQKALILSKEVNMAIHHLERNANAEILFADLSFIMADLIKKE